MLTLAGLALRSKDIHNPNSGIHWSESVLFSLVVELGDLYDVAGDKLDGSSTRPGPSKT